MGSIALLAEAHAAGLEVQADAGRLIVRGPRSADALARRLLAHKPELMALLVSTPHIRPSLPVGAPSETTSVSSTVPNMTTTLPVVAPSCGITNATAAWHAALDRLEDDPLFPPDVIEGLRTADVEWVEGHVPAIPAPDIIAVGASSTICRCGSTTWHDVKIHGGRSVRRDCGRCGRFIDFPVWGENQSTTTCNGEQ